MLIDTHSHLDFPDFDADREDVIRRATEAGVTRLIAIGTNLKTSRAAIALSDSHSQIYATVGIHPSEVGEVEDSACGEIEQLASHPKVVAIGECGLDYHRLPSRQNSSFTEASLTTGGTAPGTEELLLADADLKNRQAIFFQEQLDLAVRLQLNVVIHQRDSWDDTIATLKPFAGRLRAVFHCFSGTPAQAHELIQLGHAVSFTGIVTFKNARDVHESVRQLPAGSFFLETDCPYLSPEPHRGQRCEPAYTRFVAEKVASLRGVSLKEMARETTAAAEKFFRFPTSS
ncbi:MAG: TatD family hydrolase [Verrucomicrobia bacterium]|nr:TatD family hydrolase [Verrucomicrobiota bacterium]